VSSVAPKPVNQVGLMLAICVSSIRFLLYLSRNWCWKVLSGKQLEIE
jgi:hypothetical protein